MEQVEMADPLDAQVIRREDQARLARAGVIDKCTLHGRRGSVGIIACRDREQWAAKCREAAQHFRPFSGRETVFDTCAPDRKSTRLTSSHHCATRMPSSA